MLLEHEVSEYIKNLKGRKTYELKKSRKLGFESFEEYIANKLIKRQQLKDAAKQTANIHNQNESNKKEKNASGSECSCCSN